MKKVADSAPIREALAEITGTHWVGVRFYKSRPGGMKISPPAAFCSAASKAITEPALLRVASIPCPGARYAFGVPGAVAPALAAFAPARLGRLANMQAPAAGAQRLGFSPEYVGLNLPGAADIYLSFMLNESANELTQAWAAMTGRNLKTQFTGVMSFCSEGAAAAFNGHRPAFSLGCARSIKAAGLQGQVCVCLPESQARRFAKAWLREPSGAGV